MPQGDCAVKFVALLTNFSHGHSFGGGIGIDAILDREQTQISIGTMTNLRPAPGTW